jgi:hypothetical protein
MSCERHLGGKNFITQEVIISSYGRSSFYGLLDLLSGTELNLGQTEIGRDI